MSHFLMLMLMLAILGPEFTADPTTT